MYYGEELETGMGSETGKQCLKIYLLCRSFQMKGTHPAWPQDISLRFFFSAGFQNGWCRRVRGAGQTKGSKTLARNEIYVPQTLVIVLDYSTVSGLLFQSLGLFPELTSPIPTGFWNPLKNRKYFLAIFLLSTYLAFVYNRCLKNIC